MGRRYDRVSLYKEIDNKLKDMECFGESKKAAKIAGTAKNGIYSYSTAQMYHRECQKFAEYVAQNAPQGRYTSLEDAKCYAKEYIAQENADEHKSAYTVKMERSALAKLYQCSGNDLGEVRSRSREDITRSRKHYVTSEKTGKDILNPQKRAGHFSESKHADEVEFAKGTGMRRSEMESVRGDQLHEDGNGGYYFHMDGNQCKGGRERDIPVRGDVDRIVELSKAAGNGKIFGKVSHNMDVHYYRGIYASSMYYSLAREDIPKEDRYSCRKDLKGTTYDKKAMAAVSQALGHSRIDVIAGHYLHSDK